MKTYSRLGRNQANALNFIKQCTGWQSFNTKCRATTSAIKGLERRGIVMINEYGQFKLNPFLK